MKARTLLVGASGGIGAALGATLKAGGTEVIELSRSINGFDLSDPVTADRALSDLSDQFNQILFVSGILAPAGSRPEKSLAEFDAANMAKVLAINAIGPAIVLRHAPRLLPRKEHSTIGVLTARVGSIGDNRLGGWYSYRASKAAANQIVHTAAIELARTHKLATVVALHPGTVDTDFTSGFKYHAKVPADQAAKNLLSVLDGLGPKDTGGFFDWAGAPVPW